MNTFPMADQFNQLVKIVLVGEANVGKTALVHRFVRNQAPPRDISSTIGVEFSKRLLDLPKINMRAQVHIWDTAGQERFKSLTTHHYKGAQGALLVFDVTSYQSFEAVQQWLRELSDNTQPNCQIALISNKCDLLETQQPVIKENEVKKFAQQNGLIYYETSSYWDRQQVNKEGERGGIGALITLMVENIVNESLREDQYNNQYNQNKNAMMPANASQRSLKPQDVARNNRNEAFQGKNAYDDNQNAKMTIKDKKMMGGREKTEIRVSGIRLDKNQLFEVENKQESSYYLDYLSNVKAKQKKQDLLKQKAQLLASQKYDTNTLAKIREEKQLMELKMSLAGKSSQQKQKQTGSSGGGNSQSKAISQLSQGYNQAKTDTLNKLQPINGSGRTQQQNGQKNESEIKRQQLQEKLAQLKEAKETLKKQDQITKDTLKSNQQQHSSYVPQKPKDLTEEERRQMREQLEADASLALLLKGDKFQETRNNNSSTKAYQAAQQYEEYDPLGIASDLPKLRPSQSSQSNKDFLTSIDKKMRQELGVSTDLNEIKLKIEKKQREEQERQDRERREQRIKEREERRQKEQHASLSLNQKGGTTQLITKNSRSDQQKIEAQKLMSKLKNPDKKKLESKSAAKPSQNSGTKLIAKPTKKEQQIFCARCAKFHDVDFHKSKEELNNQSQTTRTQKMVEDTDTKSMRPGVNIVNAMDSRKPQTQHKEDGRNRDRSLREDKHDRERVRDRTQSRDYDRRDREPDQQRYTVNKGQQKRSVYQDDYDERDRLYRQKLLRERVENDRSRKPQKLKPARGGYDDDEDNLSFIVDDDDMDENELDPRTKEEVKKLLGKRRYYYNDYDSESDDMEVGYDQIEREERIAARIAKREDDEELEKIKADEAQERKQRKLMKKQRRH
eukprot:403364640